MATVPEIPSLRKPRALPVHYEEDDPMITLDEQIAEAQRELALRRKCQIPPDLVVDRWASNSESGSHRPFLFRYDVWTMFRSQIHEKITSALSMA